MKKIDADSILERVYNNDNHDFYKVVREWEKSHTYLTFWEMDALACFLEEGTRGFNVFCRITGLHHAEYWEKREKIENILKGDKEVVC